MSTESYAVAAARRSRPYPRAHPLLRIGDPSPYAPLRRFPLLTHVLLYASYPTVFSTSLNTIPALVAIDTSLAGAQTTPPETRKSSPKRKKLQKPLICRTFTSIPSAKTSQPFVKPASRRNHAPDYARLVVGAK